MRSIILLICISHFTFSQIPENKKSKSAVHFTIPKKYWRDTICQNNLRLNYTPQPMAASCQTPPVYDFIGTTLVQVYSGIATTKNDNNLSFTTLVNGFGNLSLITSTPILSKKNSFKKHCLLFRFFFVGYRHYSQPNRHSARSIRNHRTWY